MAELRLRWISSVLLAAASAACSGTAPRDTTPAPRAAAADTIDYDAIYRARMDSARMRFTPEDVRFVTGMIGHHAQALVMADLAQKNGASPSIETLAARIINAQNDEIALMQQWLKDRGQPVPEVHIAGTQVMVHGAQHHENMPGMLSPEQMRELEVAKGREFDRLFLTYMIQHHQGAVTMVHELFRTHGAGQDEPLFKIASDIQVDQATEIARMERMLAAVSGSRQP